MLFVPVIHSHRVLGAIVSILEFILRAMRTYCRFLMREGVLKRTRAEMRPADQRVPRVSATAWKRDNGGFSLMPVVELERMDKCVICLVGEIPNLATLVL